MFKYFYKYNKVILAVAGTFLMLIFGLPLGGQAVLQMLNMGDFPQAEIAGKSIYASDQIQAGNELAVVNTLPYAPIVDTQTHESIRQALDSSNKDNHVPALANFPGISLASMTMSGDLLSFLQRMPQDVVMPLSQGTMNEEGMASLKAYCDVLLKGKSASEISNHAFLNKVAELNIELGLGDQAKAHTAAADLLTAIELAVLKRAEVTTVVNLATSTGGSGDSALRWLLMKEDALAYGIQGSETYGRTQAAAMMLDPEYMARIRGSYFLQAAPEKSVSVPSLLASVQQVRMHLNSLLAVRDIDIAGLAVMGVQRRLRGFAWPYGLDQATTQYVSLPEVRQSYFGNGVQVDAEVVRIDAQEYLAKFNVPDPSPEKVEELFNDYKAVKPVEEEPNEKPYPFSYLTLASMNLEYMAFEIAPLLSSEEVGVYEALQHFQEDIATYMSIANDEVTKLNEAAKASYDSQLEAWKKLNPDKPFNLPAFQERPLYTLPKNKAESVALFKVVQSRVENDLKELNAETKLRRILQFVKRKISDHNQTVPEFAGNVDENGFFPPVADTSKLIDFNTLREMVKEEFDYDLTVRKFDLPVRVTSIDDLTGIGKATYTITGGGSSGTIPLKEYVRSMKELFVGDARFNENLKVVNRLLRFQENRVSESFETRADRSVNPTEPNAEQVNRLNAFYLFRLSNVVPDSVPESIDNVIERASMDAKRIKALDQIAAESDDLKFKASQSMQALVNEFGAKLADLEGVNLSTGSEALEGLGISRLAAQPLLRHIVNEANGLIASGDEDLSKRSPAELVSLLRDDKTLSIYLVRIKAVQPPYAEEFNARKDGMIDRAGAMGNLVQRRALLLDAMKKRLGFSYGR